jgi:hypothetical protein
LCVACLSSRKREGRADSDLGLAWVKRVPIHKCWLLLGGAFGCWIQDASWQTMGWTEGLGEISMLLQGDGYACGCRHLLDGVVLGQAVQALLRRPLYGGVVRVARGFPFWLSESRSAPTWSVASWVQCTLPPTSLGRCFPEVWSGPAAHSPTSLGGMYVDACYPGVRVCFEWLLQL